MKKVEFIWTEGYNNDKKEIFEFEDNVTDDEIQSAYDTWIG